jgi:hypothetical protein
MIKSRPFAREDITERVRRPLEEHAKPWSALHSVGVVLAAFVIAGATVGWRYAGVAKDSDVQALTAQVAEDKAKIKSSEDNVRELRTDMRDAMKLLVGIAAKVGAPTRP